MANAIIGSNGFIGSALKRYADSYLEEEWVGITRENYSMWKETCFDKVIWAAGTARKDLPRRDLMGINTIGIQEALNDIPALKYIYISSQAVYADPRLNHDYNEDHHIIPAFLDWYGLSKYLGEVIVKESCDNWLIVRPNGFTGPGLKKNVIHSMAKQPPELYYSWDSRAQYIHVDHFAHILFKLASASNGKIINLTSPDAITPVDVANVMGADIKKVKMPKDRIIPSVQAIINTKKLEGALNAIGEPLPSSKEAIRFWNEPFKIPVPVVRSTVGRS